MIYKKNTRTICNADNVVLQLSCENDVRKISVIAYDGDAEIASIVSVIHNLDMLNEGRCYEVIGIFAIKQP